MSRLILVPQYPTKLRYQEWWWVEFPKQFKQYFDEVLVLGRNSGPFITASGDKFTPMAISIQFEAQQIKDYSKLELRKDDILLLCDLSFPGFFANVLFHKRPNKCFAICHATSKNAYDYFQKDRRIKYPIEKATAKLFNTVFVASEYHAKKLGWLNIKVQALPMPPIKPVFSEKKQYDIVNVSRPGLQKRNFKIESYIQRKFGLKVRTPPNFETWEQYYEFLGASKILLITAKEETFGYQVFDAIINGCIPIAPNAFSYPEFLPKNYLYNSKEELAEIILKVFHRKLDPLSTPDFLDFYYEELYYTMQFD